MNKLSKIVSFLAGLVALLLGSVGCSSSSHSDHSMIAGPNGTMTKMNIEDKASKKFALFDGLSLAFYVQGVPVYGNGQGFYRRGDNAQQCDEYGRPVNYDQGGRGRRDDRYDHYTDGYGREPRPYVQNTQGRRTNPRVEQPQYRPAYRDQYGNEHPEGYYYASGAFYSTH